MNATSEFVRLFEAAYKQISEESYTPPTPEYTARKLVERHGVNRAFEIAERHLAEATGDAIPFWHSVIGNIG